MLKKLVCDTIAFNVIFVISDYGFVFSINEKLQKESIIS